MPISRLFERDAVYIDSRIAGKKDFEFVKYLKATRWALTGVALFAGLNYDNSHASDSHASDHFFSDRLRDAGDFCSKDGTFLSLEAFGSKTKDQDCLRPVLSFFDGLSSQEQGFGGIAS